MAKVRFGKIETPGNIIKTLEIQGAPNDNGDEMSHALTANKDYLVCRGSENFCVSVRDSLLENRDCGYVIPEGWDQFWNYKLGAIWTPSTDLLASGNTAPIYLKSEEIVESTTVADTVDSWGDAVSSPAADYVDTATTNNRFPYVDFNGTNDILYFPNPDIPSGVATTANVDYAIAMVLDLPDDNSFQTVLQINDNPQTGAYRIRHDSRTTTNAFEVRLKISGGVSLQTLDVSSNFSYTDTNIIMIGRINNEHFVRVNGNDAVTAAGNGQGVTTGSTDLTVGCGYALGVNNGHTNMNLYELAFLKADSQNDTAFLNDLIKFEGSLARKFDMVDVLPSDHTYKNEPPRVITA